MDPDTERHLMGLYGLDPNMQHPALGFPRLPPMALARLGMPQASGMRDRRLDAGRTARANLDMFREDYNRTAAGLLDGRAAVPPGHPLRGDNSTMSSLRAENDRLQEENAKLKRRLEGSDRNL